MDSSPRTNYPQVLNDMQVDVAVVGAGIAGISTAWELVRAGRSVAVFEADRIVAGTTGYTTAKLTAQHSLVYDRLRSSFDAETARLYAQSQVDAIDRVARTVAELGIDCDLERAPAYTYTLSPDNVAQIHAEVDAARAAGLPASFATETGLPFPVAGAIRVDDQAQFHPRRYLLALAEDLSRNGGQIFEHTRIVDLEETAPCRLTTENGATLSAQHVVIATQFPVFDRAKLFTRLVPRREFVVAAAIPAERDPGGMYLTKQDNTRSVRTAPYHAGKRLLIVTGEGFRPGASDVAQHVQRLADWTRQHFQIDALAYRWAAQDYSTTDGLPYIGRFHSGAERVWVATGFGSWGMTNGVMAGPLLTALINGHRPEWAGIYDPGRLHPIVESSSFLKASLNVARRFIGDRLRPKPDSGMAANLSPGTGEVIRVSGESTAIYRDDAGKLEAVSATCTHLGCTVGFNDVERSWDCPCHGSRFSTDGAILHGPAVRPLEHRDPPD